MQIRIKISTVNIKVTLKIFILDKFVFSSHWLFILTAFLLAKSFKKHNFLFMRKKISKRNFYNCHLDPDPATQIDAEPDPQP
jgi:hypothetical protein